MTYRKWVMSKAKKLSKRDALTMAAMGLSGEAGEVTDEIKKVLFHGRKLDKEKLLLEISDYFWYHTYLCELLGFTQEQVEKANMDKLNKRYEKKYTNKASRERKDVK